MDLNPEQKKAFIEIGFVFVKSDWINKPAAEYDFSEETLADGFDPDIPTTLFGNTEKYYGEFWMENKWVLEIDGGRRGQIWYLTLDVDNKGFSIYYSEPDGTGSPCIIKFDILNKIQAILLT